MIGNFDDQMARLAFGEVSDAERERLREEAERNPVVAARLREYEALRFELTRLREVPSDQLSKERLREALLARAIRPEPKRAWNWGYASLAGFAFCAAAAVVWSTRLLHTPEPAVILDAAKSASSTVALRAPRDLPIETPSTAANTAVPSTPALVASRTVFGLPASVAAGKAREARSCEFGLRPGCAHRSRQGRAQAISSKGGAKSPARIGAIDRSDRPGEGKSRGSR
jgi:hypothetical protein